MTFPARLEKSLRYVPPAVLTAIIVPAVLIPSGDEMVISYTNPYLVATDMTGAVRSKDISWYRWRAMPPDSLEVTFGMSYAGTTFRGVAKGRDYVGEISVRWDVGEPVQAMAYLHRVDCAHTKSGNEPVGRHGT